MTVRASLRSGDSATLASPALLAMLLCCSSGGTVGETYTFEPGSDVAATIGGGIGADATYALLRETQGTVKVTLAEPTWGPLPSVVKVGSGPTVSVALAEDAEGPFDDFKIVFTVDRGGAGGAGAQVTAAYDGATIIETLQIPAEVPAVLTGTVDITNGAGLEGLTLVFTAPSSDTLTFGAGSLTGAAAGLKAATGVLASPVTLTASDLLTAGKAAILANPRRLTFATAGSTPADAPASCTITGTKRGVAVSEVLALSQTVGSVTSAKDYDVITSIAYLTGQGTDCTIAVGYGTGFASPAEIVAAFDALALAAALLVNARADQSTDGNTYLQLFTTSAGAAVTQTIDDATSTADGILGFSSGASNITATGAAATMTPPWTGLTFTWPASADYIVGDTYTTTCLGPRASISALTDAATLAHDGYSQAPFGFLVVAQPAGTASNCAALESALATLQAEWLADPYNPVFIDFVVGSQFHTASANVTTNNTNIQTADTALGLAFQAASANLGNVAVDDVYLPGSTSLRFGSYRRTAALAWAAKHGSAAKLAADVADGLVPEATLLGPDLLTRARNEATSTTKLGGGSGPGFSVLRSTPSGLGFVQFVPGATRAGPTSRLRFIGPVTVGLEIARIVYPLVTAWIGQTLPANPLTQQMSDAEKKDRQTAVYTALAPTLLPSDGPANVTQLEDGKACNVQILNPSTGKFLDNGQVRVRIQFIPLGEIEAVFVDISATGAVLSEAA